ncbi:hypothetical protein LCM28_09880 [Salipiger pacificus]|nr:hypothetical protein [Alloyangia pacifica]
MPSIGGNLTKIVGIQKRVLDWAKEESGRAALDYAQRVYEQELLQGTITKDTEIFTIESGIPRRRSSMAAINPFFLPFPPVPGYQFAFSAAVPEDLLKAAQFAWDMLHRNAPKFAGTKSHRIRYSGSFQLRIDERLQNGGPETVLLERLSRESVLEIVNVAPHSSYLERKAPYEGRLFHATAQATLAKFGPAVAVRSSYVFSDQRGATFGKHTGGRTKGGSVYALPIILIGLAGPSGVTSGIGAIGPKRRNRPHKR